MCIFQYVILYTIYCKIIFSSLTVPMISLLLNLWVTWTFLVREALVTAAFAHITCNLTCLCRPSRWNVFGVWDKGKPQQTSTAWGSLEIATYNMRLTYKYFINHFFCVWLAWSKQVFRTIRIRVMYTWRNFMKIITFISYEYQNKKTQPCQTAAGRGCLARPVVVERAVTCCCGDWLMNN